MADEYESDNDHMMTKLVLLNGTVKDNFVVRMKNDVAKEKIRILSEVHHGLPPEELMFVILDEHSKELVMNEGEKMDYYRDSISTGTIEIRYRNSTVHTTPTGNKSSLESFGVSMK